MAGAAQAHDKGQHGQSRIPRFKSVAQAADWFDSHSLGDYEDELEQVTEDLRFVLSRGGTTKPMTIRLGQADFVSLTKLAQRLGVGPSALARTWILEQLQEQTAKAAPSGGR